MDKKEPGRLGTSVPERPRRRRFSATYKAKILAEADACQLPGELGALLRREGLYSSHLANWRKARLKRGVEGLHARKRGPKANPKLAESKRIAKLERELARTQARLERAEGLLELQKKVAELLAAADEDSEPGSWTSWSATPVVLASGPAARL